MMGVKWNYVGGRARLYRTQRAKDGSGRLFLFRARRERLCDRCNGRIEPGQRYYFAKLTIDGCVRAWHFCLECGNAHGGASGRAHECASGPNGRTRTGKGEVFEAGGGI